MIRMNPSMMLGVVIILILAVFYNVVLTNPNTREESKVEFLPLDSAIGPESIAFDPNEEGPYSGVSDGRILKWEKNKKKWIEYAYVASPELLSQCRGSQDLSREHLCGRPLGLEFSKTGDLYIADAYLGLLVVRPGAKYAETLINNEELGFTNGVCIHEDKAVIYFTDSSRNFKRRQFLSTVLSGDKTGRLMKFDLKTEEVQVLLDGLSFPNGLVLSEDGSFLIFLETSTCRLMRYWIQTRKAGQLEVLATLPGFPDNISRSPRGGVWVALHSKNSKLIQFIFSIPWARKLMLSWGPQIQRITAVHHKWSGGALALRMSEDGKVLEYLQGFGGKKLRFISEVKERNGSLWIGSVLEPFAAIYHL